MYIEQNLKGEMIMVIGSDEGHIFHFEKKKKMFWIRWSDIERGVLPDAIKVVSHKTGKSITFMKNGYTQRYTTNANEYWTYKPRKGRVKFKDLKVWVFDDVNKDFDMKDGL